MNSLARRLLEKETCDVCGKTAASIAQVLTNLDDWRSGSVPIYITYVRCCKHRQKPKQSLRQWWFHQVDAPLTKWVLRITGKLAELENQDGSR